MTKPKYIEMEISKIKILKGRRVFDKDNINFLAESIDNQGLLEPIIITQKNILVAGHRRLTACKQLGLKTIPCIKKTFLCTLFPRVLGESLPKADSLPALRWNQP